METSGNENPCFYPIYFNFFKLKKIIRILMPVLFLFSFLPNVQAQESPEIHKMRDNWFKRQRTYPHDTIPQNAVYEAIQQQFAKRQQLGFYLGPSLQWMSIGPTPYFNYSEEYRTGRIASTSSNKNF